VVAATMGGGGCCGDGSYQRQYCYKRIGSCCKKKIVCMIHLSLFSSYVANSLKVSSIFFPI
jgi:hypothetical protein